MRQIDTSKIIRLTQLGVQLALIDTLDYVLDTDRLSDIPEGLKEIDKAIYELILAVDESLNSEINDRNAIFGKIEQTEELTADAFLRILKEQGSVRNIVSKLVSARNESAAEKLTDELTLDNHAICHEIAHALSHLTNEEKGICSMFMSALPLRMTRARYADYITQCAKIAFSDERYNRYALEKLKSAFYMPLCEETKQDFPLLYEKLGEYNTLDINSVSGEDLSAYIEDLQEQYTEFEKLIDYTVNLYYLLTDFRIIYPVATDNEFVFDSLPIKDIYFAVCEYIKSGKVEDTEELSNRLADLADTLLTEQEKLEKELNVEELNGVSIDDFDEEAKLPLRVLSHIKYQNCAELSAYIPERDIINTEGAVKELLDYISSSIDSLDRAEQKRIKQEFFIMLPCIYSYDELLAYANYSLDGVASKTKALAAYQNILNIVNMIHDLHPHEHEHHHEHDHHHEHEHHHHEHCDCGHKH